jgi:acid phosphatase family membrane protein YuiD
MSIEKKLSLVDEINQYVKKLSRDEQRNLRDQLSKIMKKKEGTNKFQAVAGIAMILGIILGLIYVIYFK